MNDDLLQLCQRLKLRRILKILDRELRRAEKQEPSYDEFLARLLREELHAFQERSLEHRIRRARLPERWALESFPFDRQPGVRKAALLQLASLEFVPRAENLVFIGETGVGKTGLASGLLL